MCSRRVASAKFHRGLWSVSCLHSEVGRRGPNDPIRTLLPNATKGLCQLVTRSSARDLQGGCRRLGSESQSWLSLGLGQGAALDMRTLAQ